MSICSNQLTTMQHANHCQCCARKKTKKRKQRKGKSKKKWKRNKKGTATRWNQRRRLLEWREVPYKQLLCNNHPCHSLGNIILSYLMLELRYWPLRVIHIYTTPNDPRWLTHRASKWHNLSLVGILQRYVATLHCRNHGPHHYPLHKWHNWEGEHTRFNGVYKLHYFRYNGGWTQLRRNEGIVAFNARRTEHGSKPVI